jgi:hypothetical protein
MNARYRIEEWFRRLERPGEKMNREDVSFIMVQARHLIESADDPEDYRLARFYADWTAHPALDRSIVCLEMVRDISRILVENLSPTRPDFTREVSRIIGLPQLRSELMDLFRAHGLPTVLFDYLENWRTFVSFLLWFLKDQPIGFPHEPTGQAKKIHDETLALAGPHNMSVKSLAVVDHEGFPHWQLRMAGDKGLTIVGRLEIAEAPDAFSPPP